MALFPTALFFFAPYTESLFVVLAILTVWMARRGQWMAAAAAGFAAAITRLPGVCLMLVIGWELIRQHGGFAGLKHIGWKLGYALGPGFGLGAVVLWKYLAGFPSTVLVQTRWERTPGYPGEGIVLAIARVIEGIAAPLEYIDLILVLLMIGLATAMLVKRYPHRYNLYMIGMLTINLSQYQVTQPLFSQGRYTLALFPPIGYR